MTDRIEIRNGRVFDPAHGIDGSVRTLFLADGKVVESWPTGTVANRVIDASGAVVFPGGVDVHSHIVGPAVNRGRRLLGHRSAALTPRAALTGRQYAAMGYTTAVDAAIAVSSARQAHWELADTPNVDVAFLLLVANNELLLQSLAAGDRARTVELVRVLLARSGAFGIKAVNPGGVAAWHHGGDPCSVATLDDRLDGGRLTPRAILETLADAAIAADLPHPLHVHANRLGLPGNVAMTLDTLRALAGRRHHLTHAQFHAYADDGKGGFASGAAELMDYVNTHTETTLDVGQVMFGPALTITEDSPMEFLLWQLTGKRWASVEVEAEAGCGMLPFEFKPANTLHALQWAVGLEIFLRAADPWRVALSTDHPNGGSFRSYPRLIATLMDPAFRAAEMARCPTAALDKTGLRELTRAYTLREIAIITRAGPARILGLVNKGHLGVGADADVTVYDDRPDREAMFAAPRWVIKAGRVVVEDGHLREDVAGSLHTNSVVADPLADRHFRTWWSRHGSTSPDQLTRPTPR